MNHSTTSGANMAFRTARSAMTTSKALFFAAAGISFALSIWLWFSGDRERGLFVESTAQHEARLAERGTGDHCVSIPARR